MEPDALCRQFDRKSGGMRTLPGTLVNRFVRDKPGIASAAFVPPIGVRPSLDIRLVHVRNPNGQTINFAFPLWCEVKNKLVAVVDEALGVDRLEVSVRRDTSFPFD